MNKWVALAGVAAGMAAFIAAIVVVLAWLARRYERSHDLGDDGGSLPDASPLDHLAIDQAYDDAHHHHD